MPDGLATKCNYWFCRNRVCTICLSLPFNVSYIVTLSASQGDGCAVFHPGCIGYYSLDGFCCRVSLELFLALEKGISGPIPTPLQGMNACTCFIGLDEGSPPHVF